MFVITEFDCILLTKKYWIYGAFNAQDWGVEITAVQEKVQLDMVVAEALKQRMNLCKCYLQLILPYFLLLL